MLVELFWVRCQGWSGSCSNPAPDLGFWAKPRHLRHKLERQINIRGLLLVLESRLCCSSSLFLLVTAPSGFQGLDIWQGRWHIVTPKTASRLSDADSREPTLYSRGCWVSSRCFQHNSEQETTSRTARPQVLEPPSGLRRGKRLHIRNQHLRNHRGFSAAFSNGLSVACSNIITLFNGIYQMIVTCSVDVYWKSPMAFQWQIPI